jgi:uncharacterized protein DUF429
VGVIEVSDQQTRFVPITDRKRLAGAVLAGIGLGMFLGWRRTLRSRRHKFEATTSTPTKARSAEILDDHFWLVFQVGLEDNMPMFVAGVDGCRAPEGWVWFKVEVSSLDTSVELVELPRLLRSRPSDLAFLAIDIPVGLLDGSRACDKAARKLLGQPRGTSVFAAPCRAALTAKLHPEASAINRQKTGRGLSQQAFGIGSKIKQVDDAIMPDRQQWAFEVHPEVCFWALNGSVPWCITRRPRRA